MHNLNLRELKSLVFTLPEPTEFRLPPPPGNGLSAPEVPEFVTITYLDPDTIPEELFIIPFLGDSRLGSLHWRVGGLWEVHVLKTPFDPDGVSCLFCAMDDSLVNRRPDVMASDPIAVSPTIEAGTRALLSWLADHGAPVLDVRAARPRPPHSGITLCRWCRERAAQGPEN